MMRRGVVLATVGLALAVPAAAVADDGFVEKVRVLHSWQGEPNGYFGWAVSELADIDRDRATDLIISEPATADGGRTWVYSGRTGRRIYRLPGEPGDFQGNAIADAGDTNGDGVHDIISGAIGNSGNGGPGRAYLYSGRSGRLLHMWEGTGANDQLGAAVATAGDVNHDGFDDVLVGANGVDGIGVDSGAVYVFSGRTYKVLRRYDGAHAGDNFGSGTDWVAPHKVVIGAFGEAGGGGAHVFLGGHELFSLAPPPGAAVFGQFFVAGVGRVDGDRTADIYAADYAAAGRNGYAAVYSGRDGSVIHAWPGANGEGTGPGREAGDVNFDGRMDLAVGSYRAGDGAPMAGRVDVRSGRTGRVLRTITSTTAGEQLGFDAVGVGDVSRDGRPDLLLSAAEGDTVYLVAGR
jgi:FG-GAP repeat